MTTKILPFDLAKARKQAALSVARDNRRAGNISDNDEFCETILLLREDEDVRTIFASMVNIRNAQ